MIFTERDWQILKSLQYGLTSQSELIEEHFMVTEAETANEGFQNTISNQVRQANENFEMESQLLVEATVEAFQIYAHDFERLKKELQATMRELGRHLGNPLREISRHLSSYHVKDIDEFRNEILHNYQSISQSEINKRILRNRSKLCTKVMRRLVGAKLVKELIGLDRRQPESYYHLTKNYGKVFVQQELAKEGNFELVIAHNYNKLHAKHESMVTSVIKKVFSFAEEQEYIVEKLLGEAEQKSKILTKKINNKGRSFNQYKKKGYFLSDLIVKLRIGDQKTIFLDIEIDNGTQSTRTVYGKVSTQRPILIICSTAERGNSLLENLDKFEMRRRNCFVTSFEDFNNRGIFDSICIHLPSCKKVKIDPSML